MTFKQIKKLKLEDFETKNEEVWESIEKLSVIQIDGLFGLWKDDDIQNSLAEIQIEKCQKIIGKAISKSGKEVNFAVNRLIETRHDEMRYLDFDENN